MPHLPWAGTPRDQRLASSRCRRRAVSAVVAGCLTVVACTGDDDTSTDAASGDAADAPTDHDAPVATTTDPAAPDESAPVEPEGAALDASGATDLRTRPDGTPPTTEPTLPRCGDDVDPSGPVTLTVWHGLSGDAAEYYVDDIIARFETEHPDIAVDAVKADMKSPGGVSQLFEPGVATPDVVLGTNLTVRSQAESGAFIPVVECTGGRTPSQFADLLPAVDLLYRVDGTLWAAPYNVSTPLLMYDGNVWRDAGLDPDRPPTTIDELLDTARALDESGVVDTGMVLYDKAALWLITETAAKAGRSILEPDNGHLGGPIEAVSIVDADTIALVDELRSMHRDGLIFWAGVNGDNRVDLSKLVAPTEPSGLTLHTSASLGDIFRLQDAERIPPVDVRVAPLPGPGPGATPGGGAWWLLDGDDPDRVAAAWKFVDWMTQPQQIADLAAYTGYVPSTPTAAALPITEASWDEHPQYRVGYEQVAATPATTAAVGIQIGPMTDVLRAIELGLSDAIHLGEEAEPSLRDAVASIGSIIDAYEVDG